MTIDDVVKLVDEAIAGFELVAPELGVAELQPLADSVRKLLDAVVAAIEDNPAAELKAEVAGADAAADAAEDVKFGVK